MASEKPDRIYSTVKQSFSHGRTRTVQVEIIPSTKPRPEKKRTALPKEKKKTSPTITVAKPLAKKTVDAKVRKHKKKKTDNRKRSPAGSSLLSSTSGRSRLVDVPTKVKGQKRSAFRRASSGARVTSTGLSAGMPGNEDVDPPTRSSSSTPMDRWRDQIGIKR
jgi:hypothetical protein